MPLTDLSISLWPIDKIRPYPKNARKIPPAAVDKVAKSLQEFGWRQPIVVDIDGVIVAGHVRYMGAVKLGWKEAPVHVASDLRPAQIKAYRLADNRTHDEATWDLELVALEIADLAQMDLALDATGFTQAEIDAMKAPATGLTEPDQPAPPAAEAVSQRGDIWRMDEHALLCGDSTNLQEVGAFLAGRRKPFLMVTDPPYGVEYDPRWRERYDHFERHAVGKVSNDHQVDWTQAYRLFPGDVMYVWHAGVYAAEVSAGIELADFEIRAQIIWRKQHFVFGRGAYHWQHEPCWYAVRKGANARWNGDRTQTTVWDVQNLNPMGGNKDEAPTGHGTQKPVELMRRPIENHTQPGDVVYDPFLGSGTTLIAAEQTRRVCLGVDLDPLYVDVAVRRWEAFTGRKATTQNGATFEEVAESRKGAPACGGAL
jgi:DNA modification methylase